MDPKTERKLQKAITKLNITPEDLKAFIASSEAEDEEVDKLVEEANAEKEEPKNEATDGPEAKQGKDEPAKEEPKQEESAPETDPAKQEKEAKPEQKPDEPKAKEEADNKEAPAPEAKDEANEYKKALEGVNAKIDGLVDALTKAGVILTEKPQVGVDGDNLPANDVGKSTQNVLDAINKGRRY